MNVTKTIDNDTAVVEGLAQLARQQLSHDKGFYIVTFDQVGPGQFQIVGDGTRRKGVAALECAARALRKKIKAAA